MSDETQNPEIERLLDLLKEVLPAGDQSVRAVSLLISLPQSLERMKRAKFDLRRAQKDIVIALDMLADHIGKLGDSVLEDTFQELKRALSDINIKFTGMAAKIHDE